MKTILVTGATGNVGGAVVRALSANGYCVRAATRRPGDARFATGVEPVRFDYEDASTHAPALEGVDGLVLVAPPLDPKAPAKVNPVIDRAKGIGNIHTVLISALGVDAVEQAPLRQVERHLMGSGMTHTILRPNFFMDNFTTGFLASGVRKGGIYLAAGDARTSFIATSDIAEVVVSVFKNSLTAKDYNLTGPEALDHATVASIISKVSGKPVTYHALTEDEMLQGMRDMGLPEGAVDYAKVLYGAVRAGYTATITPEFEKVTGTKPKGFMTFAQENEESWK